MTEHLRAYNSLWQVRGDSWCRLEEAADRLTRPTTTGGLREKYLDTCRELLERLSTLEPYWAYPDGPNSRASQGFSHRATTTSSRKRWCGSTAR